MTIATGLLVHEWGAQATAPASDLADFTADALYAVLVYLLVGIVGIRLHRVATAGAALTVCTLIELFQLTGLPSIWASAFPPIALVFGSGFALGDLVAYAVGTTAAVGIDALCTRALRRRYRISNDRAGTSAGSVVR